MSSEHITGQGWSLSVDRDRGAKITSLRDPSGTEWLTQPVLGAATGPGTAFVDSEMAGWDECAPSIVRSSSSGIPVPDHGSLWNRPFTGTAISASAHDADLGFTLTRRACIDSHGPRLEYEVVATRRQPFMWAAHPQFLSPRGSSWKLHRPVEQLIDVTGPDEIMTLIGDAPSSAADLPVGTSQKLFLQPHDAATGIDLIRPDGTQLTITWSTACPYLGLWFDHAQYSREPVIAIEPTTAWFDSLDRAVLEEKVPWVSPDRPLHWWVRLSAPTADPLEHPS